MSVNRVEQEIYDTMITNEGTSLAEESTKQPILLVFLRHFGCTFCREALSDIVKLRPQIEAGGTKVVLVHMSDDAIANRYFQRYGLDGITHVGDPDKKFYEAFGLYRGNFTQLFGLSSWIRGFSAGVVNGHGVGPQLGDGFQMPGVFVIHNSDIKEQFIHKLSSDRPDYYELVKCCMLS